MRHFVEDDYDSMEEYESGLAHSKCKEANEYGEDCYDKPTFPPIHTEDGYDSMKEYESGIKHFQE